MVILASSLRIRAWPWLVLPLLAACAADDGLPVVRAERGTLPLVMVESGEIAAVRAQYVRPPQEWNGSVVIASLIPEGTIVAQGDTVAQLDASSLLRELTSVEDRLHNLTAQREGVVAQQSSQHQALDDAVAMADLSREQAELQLTKLTYESQTRQQEARLDASRAVNALAEARAKLLAQAVLDSLALAKADLDIASARAEQKALRERQRAMTLVAPLPGMVVYYEQEDRQGKRTKPRVGDAVDPWRPIVQIPDLSSMQVEMMVHEVDRHRLAVGLPVRLRLEAYPESAFTGAIESIARLATEVEADSGVRGFAVVARIDGSDPRLRPGMTAIVEIVLGEVADAILIPRTAVAERDGELVVFPRATWPRPTPVTAVATTPLVVAVRDGLAAGTDLIATPPKEEP
jgi:multidrug efflux pump subunit AcrA (membrane-fusion protein)